MKKLLTTSAFIAAALASTALTAKADFTAQEVFDAMTRTLKQSGVTATAETLTMDGDDIVVTGLKIGDGEESLSIDQIELRDIEEPVDGNYIIGDVVYDGGSFSADDDIQVTMGTVSVRNFQVITNPSPEFYDGYYTYAAVDGMEVKNDETTIVTTGPFESTVAPWDQDKPMASSFSVSNIVVNTSVIDDAQTRDALLAMGYESLSTDIIANATWEPKSGRLDISEMTYSIEDAADLSMQMVFGGYTMEIVDALRDMNANASPENQQAMGMAMFGLFQQMDFESASISLKDESLTGRVLDFVAGQQGMDRESVAAMAKGFLPLGLAQLGQPEFAMQTQVAVSAFLDDPDTITISANPEEPVPFAVLMGSAMSGDPASLLKTLNVSVSANE